MFIPLGKEDFGFYEDAFIFMGGTPEGILVLIVFKSLECQEQQLCPFFPFNGIGV